MPGTDVHDVELRMIDRIAALTERVARVEKLGIALVIVTASPKFGGPTLNQALGAVVGVFL